MTILAFDINKPSPAATQWGPDVTAIRDNLASITMYAASNGGRLPNWDTAITYSGDDVSTIILTNKTYTGIKIKIEYTYSGGNVNKEKYYFDKGLGGGYELVSNGVLTYTYTSGKVTAITAANT